MLPSHHSPPINATATRTKTRRRRPAARWLFLLALGLAPAAAQAQTPIFELTTAAEFASYISGHSGSTATLTATTDAVGHAAMDVVVPTSAAKNSYRNFIARPGSLLGASGQYYASLTYTSVTPPTYPDYFYMFVRNSAGTQYDQWLPFLSLPGDGIRTVVFPLNLPAIGTGNTWAFNVGMEGPGEMIISSFTITPGNTYQTDQPVLNGTPVSNLPAGVTEATGYTAFTLTPPSTANPVTINLAPPTYNFTADSASATAQTAIDNAAALQAALTACKNQQTTPAHGTKLLIPAGTYRITANSSIQFTGLQDLTIDGQGSTLIFEKVTSDAVGMTVSSCARMVLQNIVFDWDWKVKPIASLGTASNVVTNATAHTLTCDLTFADLDGPATTLVKNAGWNSLAPMDPTRLVVTGAYSTPPSSTRTVGSAANVLHTVFASENTPIVNGTSYFIRHMYYDMLAFKVVACTNLMFNAVDFNSWPGMGWLVEEATSNFELYDCTVGRPSGRRDPLTLAADGVHVNESQGNIMIKGCNFTGLGDDTINIHDNVYTGWITMDGTDNTKFTMINAPSYQLRVNPNDTLEFYNADYSPLNNPNHVTVQAQSVSSSTISWGGVTLPTTTVKLVSPRPAGLNALSIVRNTRFNTSNVFIYGNSITYTNGRGILLSASNATVSGNYLRNIFAAPFEFETQLQGGNWNAAGTAIGGTWWEGHGCNNVLLASNTFENNNQMARYNGDSIYAGSVLPWGPTSYPLFNTITVKSNVFYNSPGPAMAFASSTNVVAKLNSIRYSTAMSYANQYSGAILTRLSSNLGLGGNTWMNIIPSSYLDGVVFDLPSTPNILTATNATVNSY